MKDLIADENIATLYRADECKEVSYWASYNREIRSIATKINTTANSGISSMRWSGKLHDAVISTLQSKGYAVSATHEPVGPFEDNEDYQYVISW